MIHVGDTITLANRPADKPLKGYKNESNGLLWSIPIDNKDYNDLREALENYNSMMLHSILSLSHHKH